MIAAVLLAGWLTITATRPINSKDIEIPHDFGPPTDKDIALVLSYAGHPDRRIRSDAAWSLGDSTLSRLNPELARRLPVETVDSVRADVVQAMGRLPDRRDPAAVMKALNDPAVAVRCFALWTLGEWAANESVAGIVERVTKDESETVRMVAATTLGRLDVPASLAGLTAAMVDKSPRVRANAALAMGKFKKPSKESLNTLLNALKDPDPLVRAEVVGALGSVTNFSVEGPVAEMAADESAFVRKRVAGALRALNAVERIQTTIGLLNDKDMSVRMESASTLGTFRKSAAIEPLIAHFDDPDKFVRRSAANALVDLKLTNEVLPKVVAQLGNESARVRREAAWTLGEYRDRRATLPLCKVVSDPDKEAALNTIQALGKIADPAAVVTLLPSLRNAMSEKRAMAAWSLGEIRDKRATAALIPVLTDPEFPPRLEAATAAGKINDPAFVQPLIAVLQNVSSELFATRAAASWSLGHIGDSRAVGRLKNMVSERVIPTPFGPVYDHDSVRMNSAVALARIARGLPNAGQLQPITAFLEDQFTKGPDLSDNLKECMAECLHVLTGKDFPFERHPPAPRQYFVRSVERKD